MEAKNQPVATREEEQISGGNDSKGDELHFNKKNWPKKATVVLLLAALTRPETNRSDWRNTDELSQLSRTHHHHHQQQWQRH